VGRGIVGVWSPVLALFDGGLVLAEGGHAFALRGDGEGRGMFGGVGMGMGYMVVEETLEIVEGAGLGHGWWWSRRSLAL